MVQARYESRLNIPAKETEKVSGVERFSGEFCDLLLGNSVFKFRRKPNTSMAHSFLLFFNYCFL